MTTKRKDGSREKDEKKSEREGGREKDSWEEGGEVLLLQ